MRWINVSEGKPLDGQVVALKMADGYGAVSYGIGWWDAHTQDWVITARPEGTEANVSAWCILPS